MEFSSLTIYSPMNDMAVSIFISIQSATRPLNHHGYFDSILQLVRASFFSTWPYFVMDKTTSSSRTHYIEDVSCLFMAKFSLSSFWQPFKSLCRALFLLMLFIFWSSPLLTCSGEKKYEGLNATLSEILVLTTRYSLPKPRCAVEFSDLIVSSHGYCAPG